MPARLSPLEYRYFLYRAAALAFPPIFSFLATLRGGWVARTFRLAGVVISTGLAIVGGRNFGRANGRSMAIAIFRALRMMRGVLSYSMSES